MNTESKTIINSKGQILFFGLRHFLNDVVNGNCCFICGSNPEIKPFNDEHVIPDWILRKFNLYNQTITLPNNTRIKYGQYKIPCCQDCNTELGRIYETPISKLLSKSYSEICEEIKKDNTIIELLFKWLSLIFLKTHLKDKMLLSSQDTRFDNGYIGDSHYWEDMHHIHCICRSHYSGAKIDPKVFGTILILPAIKLGRFEFDYVDSQAGKALMLQLDDFCIIAVLNDSGAAYNMFEEAISKFSAPLSPFQLREVVAHLNFININLKERPIYKSVINSNVGYEIIVELPETFHLVEEDLRIAKPGEFLRYYVKDMIGDIEEKEKVLDEIEKGKRNYLFDENGNFINHNAD